MLYREAVRFGRPHLSILVLRVDTVVCHVCYVPFSERNSCKCKKKPLQADFSVVGQILGRIPENLGGNPSGLRMCSAIIVSVAIILDSKSEKDWTGLDMS